jgi:hypothetical protein
LLPEERIREKREERRAMKSASQLAMLSLASLGLTAALEEANPAYGK